MKRALERCLVRTRPSGRLILVAAVLFAAAAMADSCGRRGEHRPPIAEPDTLASGLPRAALPRLQGWIACWSKAIPGFAADSLGFSFKGPFHFEPLVTGRDLRFVESVRSRALIEVVSPDSTHAVDFDRYLDVSSEGIASIERDADSSPFLLDFVRDTAWTVDFCGTGCGYDGAFWIDSDRFALTGTTQSGPNLDGPGQAFLDVYDLSSRLRSRWLARPVDDEAFGRFAAANESLLLARVQHAHERGSASVDPFAGDMPQGP